ncbi:C-C motif chemokine 25 [Perognathus longimembris pacificus]|uniref:C-C motif chemokine 25 n=1 Tax=Perognathus longimembris pacificus TaxID=214514 RepID=UPI0020185285|nr:C-C motif chemokine 25 [Perognathus longimembris pacificus]
MHLWLLVCLLASFMGSWIPTIHAQGSFEDCCLRYHSNIGWRVLRHSRHYLRQDVSGSCNLPAVIFYLPRKGQIVCGNPQDREVQKAMRILNTWVKPGHISQTVLQGLQVGRKKMNSEKFKDSSHKRKASPSNSRVVMAAKKTHNHKLLRTMSGARDKFGIKSF